MSWGILTPRWYLGKIISTWMPETMKTWHTSNYLSIYLSKITRSANSVWTSQCLKNKMLIQTEKKFIILSTCFKFEDHVWIKTLKCRLFNTLVSETWPRRYSITPQIWQMIKFNTLFGIFKRTNLNISQKQPWSNFMWELVIRIAYTKVNLLSFMRNISIYSL